jgi:hypothetical protein
MGGMPTALRGHGFPTCPPKPVGMPPDKYRWTQHFKASWLFGIGHKACGGDAPELTDEPPVIGWFNGVSGKSVEMTGQGQV